MLLKILKSKGVLKIELRKDYVLDRWVIIASERKKRPRDFAKKTKQKKGSCVFCPGNEKLTPDELGRIEMDGKWVMRWFSNKFPFVLPEGNPEIRSANKFFTYSDAYGMHEMIVDVREHDKRLEEMPDEHMLAFLKLCSARITELGKLDGIKYVLVFKNWGMEAGASLAHSHTQVVAYNKVPYIVAEKARAVKAYRSCPYCEIIGIEINGKRRAFENKSFACFAPYASRFNYEAWIFPKKHIKSIAEMSDEELGDLGEILKKVLLKLNELGLPYNFFMHNSPANENLHFHIGVCPRSAVWGGFEIAGNDVINSVSPEDAAEFYRGESFEKDNP